MPAAVPDMDAPIVAGKSAAGITLHSSIQEILAQAQPTKTEHLPNFIIYTFQSVRVWTINGLVAQVGVYSGYRGLLEDTIGIGSTIAEVESWCGREVEEDGEDDLIVPGKPGWCFDTEVWSGDPTVRANRNAPITVICIHNL